MITGRPGNNVTDNIFTKIGMNLHRRPDHPLCIIKSAIYQFMDQQGNVAYKTFDDLYPIVSTTVRQNPCGVLALLLALLPGHQVKAVPHPKPLILDSMFRSVCEAETAFFSVYKPIHPR